MTLALADAVFTALRAAAPDRLPRAAAGALAARLGATDVAVFLVDYQQDRLIEAGDSQLVVRVDDGSKTGRAYAAQQRQHEPLPDGSVVLHLPLSTRGERCGVLRLRLLTPPDAALTDELSLVADLLAESLAVAGRLTDAYERRRRTQSLTLAAEMQWQLLPARSHGDDRFALAGQLEPAYSVAGDAFDWSVEGDVLWLAALDGNGRGITATMATTVAITALRNARRAGATLADQASLADQALYAQFGGEQFVSTLLLEFDLATRSLRAIDAGSPQLLRVRDGHVEHLALDAQLPLGMFEETVYRVQLDETHPLDRWVVVSDGVHAARSKSGEEFGASTLGRVIQRARLLDAAEAVRHVTRELRAHRVGDRPDDDAVVMWLDLT